MASHSIIHYYTYAFDEYSIYTSLERVDKNK